MPIPNEADATYLDQSEIDHGDIQIMEQVSAGYWVISGGAVTAQGTADGTVAVASGTARVSGSNKTISAGNVSVLTGSANPDGSTAAAADTTDARFDLITINSASQLGVLHGTLAGLSTTGDGSYLCVFPAFTTRTVLAAIFIPPTATVITSSQINDKRIVGSVDAMHDASHSLSGSNHVGTLSVTQGLGKSQALTGATAATNYVGAVASGAPASGTFAVGDFVVEHTGKIYVCTGAGTPGTWTLAGGSVAADAIFDAKGDLPVGTGADTAAKLAVTTTAGQTLAKDTAATTGLAWVMPQWAYLMPTGAISETFSRATEPRVNTTLLSTGRMSAAAIYLPKDATITSITFQSATTALSAGTNQWFALYSSALALLRQTTDDTSTAWAANSTKTLNLTSTFLTTYAGLYYVAINVTAGTVPTLSSGASINGVFNALPPTITGTSDTGLTTTAPNPATALSTTVNVIPYAYVS